MLTVLRRNRERRLWKQRAERHVGELLRGATDGSLEVPVTGLPHQRRDFLALYERLLAAEGYRLRSLVKDTDVWNARFERSY